MKKVLSIAIISLTYTIVLFGIVIITVLNKKFLKEPVKWIICVIVLVITFLGSKILCDLLFGTVLRDFYSSGYRNLFQYPQYLIDRKSW